MKGIVLEVLEEKVIVLAKDGGFIELNKPDGFVEVGEEIPIDAIKGREKSRTLRFIAAAAACFMFMVGGYNGYAYYTPQGYINIDINPSVEIGYNRFGKAVRLRGLNSEGEKIATKIKKFRHQNVSKVVDQTIQAAEEEKYIPKEHKNTVLVTVTEINKKIDTQNLEKEVEKFVRENKVSAEVVLIKGNKKTYEEAKRLGISPGKLLFTKKEIDEDQKNEHTEKKKKEIKREEKRNQKVEKQLNKEQKNHKKEERRQTKQQMKQEKEKNKKKMHQDKLNTEKLKMQKQKMKEQKIKEQKMKEQKMKEQKIKEQKIKEQRIKEQKIEQEKMKRKEIENQKKNQQEAQEGRTKKQKKDTEHKNEKEKK